MKERRGYTNRLVVDERVSLMNVKIKGSHHSLKEATLTAS